MKKPVKVYLLSLGCAKNLVNSEQMLGKLKNAGMELLDSPEGADAAIVNTCGFIDSAKTEAIEAILDLAELKKQGKLRALIAAGCLTQRYAGEFLKELPEVDAVLGTGSYDSIVEAVEQALGARERRTWLAPREASCLTGDTFMSVLELCSMGNIHISRSGDDYMVEFTGGDVDEIIEKIVE